MSTFYLDVVNGSDSNDGLTWETPKLTTNAVTALVTQYGDEVLVRGNEDAFFTGTQYNLQWEYGNIWVKTLVDEDISADFSDNPFIFKEEYDPETGIVSSIPEIYKVASADYSEGVGTTLTLQFKNTNGCYLGADFSGTTRQLVLPAVTAAQVFNKDGYYDGEANNPLNRTGITFRGGYDSTFSSVTSYTILYDSANTKTLLGSSKKYWDISNFLLIGGGQSSIVNSTIDNLVLINNKVASVSGNGGNLSSQYSKIINCFYNVQNCTITSFTNTYGYVENCNVNGYLNSITASVGYVTNCKVGNSQNGISCSNGKIIGNTVIVTNGLYTILGSGSFVSGNTVFLNDTGANNIVFSSMSSQGYFINNTILDSFYYGSTQTQLTGCKSIPNNFAGTLVNNGITTIRPGTSATYPMTIIENNLTVNIPTSILATPITTDWNQTSPDEYKSVNSSNTFIKYQVNDEVGSSSTYFYYNSGYVTIISDEQWVCSGSSSLQCNSFILTGVTAEVGTVEFFVSPSSDYTISFFVKSEQVTEFTYNLLLNGYYLYPTWISGSCSSEEWTTISYDIDGDDIPSAGTIKLFIRFDNSVEESTSSLYLNYIKLATSV